MSDPMLEQLPEADPAAIARAIVLRKLSASAKTRAELEKALAERNVPADIATAILNRFAEVGLIDDQMYAAVFARSRHEHNGLAARAISYQLAHKGIGQSEIETAVADLTPEVEAAAAIKLAEKKLKSLRNVDTTKKLERIVGFLGRKGYSASICYSAAKQVLKEDADKQDLIEFNETE